MKYRTISVAGDGGDDVSAIARAVALLEGAWEDRHLSDVPDHRHMPSEVDSEWIVEAQAVLPLLAARVQELETALRDIEWVYDADNDGNYCPSCGFGESFGHDRSCRTATALASQATEAR